MALDGNRLGDAMKAAVDALSDKTDRTAIFRALGNAVVNEITGHAVVNSSGTDSHSDAVTTTGTVS